MSRGAEGQPRRARASGGLQLIVSGRRRELGGLGLTSFLGGLTEAAFLVLITRTAIAITEDDTSFSVVGDRRLTVTGAVLVGLILVGLRIVFVVASTAQIARFVTDVVASIRRRLAGGFLDASWPTQQAGASGQLQELLTTYTQRGADAASHLTAVVTSAFSLLALLGMAVAVDPLGALAVAGGAVVLASLLKPLRTLVRRRARRSADAGMRFATALHEVSQLGQEVHVFHVQRPVEDRVERLIAENARAERGVTFARTIVGPVYSALAYVAVLGAIGVIAWSGASDMGALGAVMLVMLRSLSYGQALQASYSVVTSSVPYLESVQEELERLQRGQEHDGGRPIGSVGRIEFRDVRFCYGTTPVFEGLSFAIEPGEAIGVVGPSGGGKSTLVQLLLGLRDTDAGEILSDGRPIRDLDREEWARRVTFVPQETHLIDGSVADNIRFYRDDVSDEEIERAATLAHLDAELRAHPDGYKRQVGSGGGRLSGGQMQRLCIARALVERPDLLVLDEPTSALDVRSEHLVRTTLEELKRSTTLVIIAHRLSTLDVCDRIMVIQDGEIRAFDTPERLQGTEGFYTEALQLSGLLAPAVAGDETDR